MASDFFQNDAIKSGKSGKCFETLMSLQNMEVTAQMYVLFKIASLCCSFFIYKNQYIQSDSDLSHTITASSFSLQPNWMGNKLHTVK